MQAVGAQHLNDKTQVQVIARAAAILRALEDEADGLSLGQIAQRVNLRARRCSASWPRSRRRNF